MVYGVFDQQELIAYHEEKRVVTNYCKAFQKKNYQCKKMKSSELQRIPNYQDLYLVRFGKTFIQMEYESYIRDDTELFLSELYLCKDVLLKLYELGNIEEKERPALKKVLCLLEEEIQDTETMIPTLEELKRLKESMEAFRYHISDWEHDDYRWNH